MHFFYAFFAFFLQFNVVGSQELSQGAPTTTLNMCERQIGPEHHRTFLWFRAAAIRPHTGATPVLALARLSPWKMLGRPPRHRDLSSADLKK